jgi:hypothetical protein
MTTRGACHNQKNNQLPEKLHPQNYLAGSEWATRVRLTILVSDVYD